MPKETSTSKPKGISKVHINPKTKKKEYKCSYRYLGLDGKTHQTDTPWCETPEEALQAKRDGIEKRKEDLKRKKAKKEASVKGTVRKAYEEFLEDLKLEADSSNYREQISGKMTLQKDAGTILNHYLPDEIASIKLSQLTPSDFARWLTIINTRKKAVRGTDSVLSGKTVRKYKGILIRFNDWLDQQGYYRSSDMVVLTELKLSRVRIKKKSVGARNDRNYPTFDEFKKITDYYKGKNLGEYKNMYWYTFYTFLFFSGCRVSEVVGLQWQDIDFDAEKGLGVITI
ncbi:MAG: hypothetical protein IJL95_09730, partial [Solobacterium sp.]|nr:hypothetical protein [Solobacterium sp.]